MSFGRGQHPASVKTRFRPGHDERRHAPRSLGRSMLEHLNDLAAVDDDGRAVHDLDALEAIAADGGEDHARAIAAGTLIALRDRAWDKLDRMPKFLSMMREVLDRQLGRPLQQAQVDVHHHLERDGDPTGNMIAELRADKMKLRELQHVCALASMPAEELPPHLELPGGLNPNYDPAFYNKHPPLQSGCRSSDTEDAEWTPAAP